MFNIKYNKRSRDLGALLRHWPNRTKLGLYLTATNVDVDTSKPNDLGQEMTEVNASYILTLDVQRYSMYTIITSVYESTISIRFSLWSTVFELETI